MRGGASRPTASGDERSAAGRAGVGACLPESPCGNERAPGPVNPSLRAATKELRACEPEPPCGNERAPGLRTRASVRQRKGLRFLQNRRPCARYLCRILVAFSRGRSGTRGLRIPSAVSARRDAPEGGRKVGVRTSERVGPAWSPSRSCSRFYSRLPSSSRPSSPTSATMWVAPACSSSSREP